MKHFQKLFYNNIFRFILFLLSLVCLVFSVLSAVAAYGRSKVFNGDDLSKASDFAETSEINYLINDGMLELLELAKTSGQYEKVNRDVAELHLTDYNSWDTESVSINDFEAMTGEELVQTAERLLVNDQYINDAGNTVSAFNQFDYTYYDYRGTKEFLRISTQDFIDIADKYTEWNTREITTLPEGAVVLSDEEADAFMYETEAGNADADMPQADVYEEATEAYSYKGYSIQAEIEIKETADGDEVQVYNSLDPDENPRCLVRESESQPGTYYATINVNFGDDCRIFQKNNSTFLYSEAEDIYYNDVAGWVPLDVIYESQYLYIPIDSLDFTSDDALCQSILLAPHFDSIVLPFFASLSTRNFTMLNNAVWVSQIILDDSVSMYCATYDMQNGKSKVVTNIGSTPELDADSFEDCKQGIIDSCDLVLIYDGKEQHGYYEDIHGNRRQDVNFLNKNVMNALQEMGDDYQAIIGMNIRKYPAESNFYGESVCFELCRKFEHTIPVFIFSVFGFLLMMILLTVSTGYVVNDAGERKLKQTFLDKIPYEVFLLVLAAVVFASLILLLEYSRGFFTSFLLGNMTEMDYVVLSSLVLCAVLAYLAVVETYLTLVRRLKNKTFVKDLLVVRLIRRIGRYFHMLRERGKAGKVVLWKSMALFAFNLACSIILGVILAGVFGIDILVYVVILLLVQAVIDIYFVGRITQYATGVDVILKSINKISEGDLDEKVSLDTLSGNCYALGESVNSIGSGLQKAIEISTRDERMKAELITNVSHDIKTPLTSIINYVDLIKRERIDNEKIIGYLDVLEQKSQRLKQLTEDLVEASKASTGNIELECMNLNLVELLQQTVAEFEDKFAERSLTMLLSVPEEDFVIYADGRRSFRIIENLFQNAYKYAMPRTRIYLDLRKRNGFAEVTMKNISEDPLNISPEELTERFVRGDASRTTEGSGLGLSIAKNLTELQGGEFVIAIDGDLFRVTFTFPLAKESSEPEKTEERKTEEAAVTEIPEES